MDTGIQDGLLDAGNFIRTIEKRQGLQIACLEEIAYNHGWLDAESIRRSMQPMAKTDYAQYLFRSIGQ